MPLFSSKIQKVTPSPTLPPSPSPFGYAKILPGAFCHIMAGNSDHQVHILTLLGYFVDVTKGYFSLTKAMGTAKLSLCRLEIGDIFLHPPYFYTLTLGDQPD